MRPGALSFRWKAIVGIAAIFRPLVVQSVDPAFHRQVAEIRVDQGMHLRHRLNTD